MKKGISISIIGAGNGGQAFAGHLGSMGYSICLYNRHLDGLEKIKEQGGIFFRGHINGFGSIDCLTSNLSEAVKFSQIILITTTANAHRELAYQMAPFLSDNQIIILSPGRTCGALDFYQGLKEALFNKKVFIGEAQTLLYACRVISPGIVNIIGVKDKVLFSTLPKEDSSYVLDQIQDFLPSFVESSNIIHIGLENIGAIFHPSVVLFNAAAIERGNTFYFYRDMTPKIADFIMKLDEERLNIGKAYGLDIISAEEWVSYAYAGIEGNNLCEKMINNPAYFDILAPNSLISRQLIEDVPTGILPMMELGKIADVEVKLFESIYNIVETLLGVDFSKTGRTIARLGMSGLSKNDILKII